MRRWSCSSQAPAQPCRSASHTRASHCLRFLWCERRPYRKRSCLQGRTETSAPTRETISLPRATNRPRNDIESGLCRRAGDAAHPPDDGARLYDNRTQGCAGINIEICNILLLCHSERSEESCAVGFGFQA